MRAFCAYLLIVAHLCYLEIELLVYSVFCSRRRAIEQSERIFLHSAQKILHFLKITLGVQIEYVPPPQPIPHQAIIVCNHQSYFDILIIRAFLARRRIRFVAKKSLERHFPAVSRLMRLQSHAFIERRAKIIETMATMRRFLKRLSGTALSPVIFPEGTRSQDGTLLPFFSAGLRQAITHLDVPLVLLLIRNSYALNKLSELRHKPTPPAVRIEVVRYIHARRERKRYAKQIEMLEEEYRTMLRRS